MKLWVQVVGGVVGVVGGAHPLEYLRKLSDSMPKRMRMVLEAIGNPLKY